MRSLTSIRRCDLKHLQPDFHRRDLILSAIFDGSCAAYFGCEEQDATINLGSGRMPGDTTEWARQLNFLGRTASTAFRILPHHLS